MMADQEVGACSVCGKDGVLMRKYYHYEVDCDCCRGDTHLVVIRYCENCKPKAPTTIKITIDNIEASGKGQEF